MRYIRIGFDDRDGLTRAWAIGIEQTCFNHYGEDTTVEETQKIAEKQLATYLESTAGRRNYWNKREDYTMVAEWFDESTGAFTPVAGNLKGTVPANKGSK